MESSEIQSNGQFANVSDSNYIITVRTEILYTCEFCRKLFITVNGKKKHICAYGRYKIVKCRHCFVPGKSKNIKKRLNIVNQFICILCRKIFTCHGNIIEHMQLHIDRKGHSSPMCCLPFASFNQLPDNFEGQSVNQFSKSTFVHLPDIPITGENEDSITTSLSFSKMLMPSSSQAFKYHLPPYLSSEKETAVEAACGTASSSRLMERQRQILESQLGESDFKKSAQLSILNCSSGDSPSTLYLQDKNAVDVDSSETISQCAVEEITNDGDCEFAPYYIYRSSSQVEKNDKGTMTDDLEMEESTTQTEIPIITID